MQNDLNTIHETILRDIVDVIGDIRKADDYDDFKPFNSKRSFKSVSKASSKLILTFPLIVSDACTIDQVTMIAKSHERKCAAMLQMLFSALAIADSDDIYDYIQQFHSNINMRGDDLGVESFIDVMDKIAAEEESADIPIDIRFYRSLAEEMRRQFPTVDMEPLSEFALTNFKVTHENSKLKVLTVHEGNQPPPTNDFHNIRTHGRSQAGNITNNYNYNTPANTTHTEHRYNYDDDSKRALNRASTRKSQQDFLRNQIMPTDVKKANELLPTMMTVRFYGKDGCEVLAVIGVKAKVYVVDSHQMIGRLVSRNADNQGFHKLLKATTREISFWKDFVFAVNKAKIDALSSSHRGSHSKIWKLLERRALKSRIRRGLGMANDATAITSVVVTQEEVDVMKKEFGVDITKIPVIKPIMEAYNLMAVMIVNDSTETVKFLYDDDSNAYETLSFRSLERDSDDKNYRQIVNLMSKVAR